jgi:phosphonate transport system substrate-binding protein
MGIDADTFFAKSVIAGSHENVVIALDKGTVDSAADWWNADDDSNLTRMANKGMVKKEDFRVLYRTPLLPGSPNAYLSELPVELKQAIQAAFMEAPIKDKAAFDRLSDGKDKGYVAVSHEDYRDIVEMIQYVDDMRKKRS